MFRDGLSADISFFIERKNIYLHKRSNVFQLTLSTHSQSLLLFVYWIVSEMDPDSKSGAGHCLGYLRELDKIFSDLIVNQIS